MDGYRSVGSGREAQRVAPRVPIECGSVDQRPRAVVVDAPELADPVTLALGTTMRGDVVCLTDGAGATLATWSYDPYGKPVSSTVTTTALLPDLALVTRIARLQVLRYAGYVYDEPSGLYYLSQRYYDPGTCQFISRDPVGADGEESAYQYCGGDPIGNTDPSGAFSIGDVFSFAKKAVAAVVKTVKRAVTRVKAIAGAAVAVVSAIVGKPSTGAKASAKKPSTKKAKAKAKAKADQGGLDGPSSVGSGDSASAPSAPARALPPEGSTAMSASGDTTPFGRGNLTLRPSRPSDAEWGFAAVGTVADVLGCIPAPYMALIFWGGGAAIDLTGAALHYEPRRQAGKCTLGDVLLSLSGMVPGVSLITLEVYALDAEARAIGLSGVPWEEPR
jgi:RHS repeat-associated protein